jgi:2-methylcitrate dehydratase PrpD
MKSNEDSPNSNSKNNLTRRRMLQGAGAALASAAATPGILSAAPNVPRPVPEDRPASDHVINELSSYMAAARDRAIPDDVSEIAKQHILDTFAAMISGSQLPPGKAAIKFARAYGGDKVCTVVASNVLCGPIEAALNNAMLAHSDETDDSHAPSESHPGASVVPSALAVSERFGVGGTAFLRAVTLGYDIGPRTTMTLQTKNFKVGPDSSHAIGGMFGSAAAAASAASLNPQQMRWVIDYTVQQASGSVVWQRDVDHIEKAFAFAGVGARSGVTSAMVVQSGWTGVNDVLSGAYNFIDAYAPGADASGLLDKLGVRYEVTRTNIKKWTVGSPIQAPLDALVNMRKKHPFEANDVKSVVVHLAPAEGNIVNNREMPDISMQHMVAVMLLDKTASFASAHDKERMKAADILQQRAKVQYLPDDQLTPLLPARVTIVDVTLNDGTKLTERVDAVRGTEQNPMTHEEVVAKAKDLIAPILGAATCDKLVEKIMAIETVKDMRELRPLLQVS